MWQIKLANMTVMIEINSQQYITHITIFYTPLTTPYQVPTYYLGKFPPLLWGSQTWLLCPVQYNFLVVDYRLPRITNRASGSIMCLYDRPEIHYSTTTISHILIWLSGLTQITSRDHLNNDDFDQELFLPLSSGLR